MKIDFYYFGMQCPIIYETLSLLELYKDMFHISTYNVENDYETAAKLKMFFPFLTVVNDNLRYRAPINKLFLEKLLHNEEILEKPYVIPLSNNIFKGDIVPLTKSNIYLLADKCTLNSSKVSCEKKGAFLSYHCDDILGFLNIKDSKVMGGVEFLPSQKVPYNIPKNKDYAFITCLYHSSTEYDYKSEPLRALENYLANKYSTVFAITDEFGTFPNGNLDWFLKHGYKDEKIISVEDGYCILHLVSKTL